MVRSGRHDRRYYVLGRSDTPTNQGIFLTIVEGVKDSR